MNSDPNFSNGHFFPVEDTGGQGGFHIGLSIDLRELFHLFGNTVIIHHTSWWKNLAPQLVLVIRYNHLHHKHRHY